MTLHIDFETRSAANLKKTGAYAYAAHPTTDIWCMAYALGDEPVRVWTPGEEPPAEIVEHVMLGGVFVAHNAAFERVIWRYILGPRYGFPEPDVEQWRCTMTYAYAAGLPGSLESAAPAAGIDIAKDMTGRRLMLQMAKPRKVNTDGTIVWWDDPEKLAKLIAYCRQDVEVERALEKRLRPLSDSELALWHLDQRINDRGVLVDEALATSAKQIVGQAQEKLDARMRELTNFNVTACSNRNQLVSWVQAQGVECESVNKAALEDLLAEDSPVPEHVKDVLLVRQESARASVAKIDALLNGKSPEDNRAKGLLQFHAATTGRWGGRRFQPQNLRRPEEVDIDTVIDVVASGDYDLCAMAYDRPLSAVADILRGLLVAADGHRIVAADYSNIEGRVLAWLAGEEWKLQAFRDFDAGKGPDIYIRSYCNTFNVPIFDKKDPRRQVGKVLELAFGYQGGYGAWMNFAFGEMVEYPKERIDEIKNSWREAHPAIRQLWYDIEDAAVSAVRDKGSVTRAGKAAFKVAGSFLFMRLPSGRFLSYPYPEIREFDTPWGEPKEGLTFMTVPDVSKKAKIVEDKQNSTSWARVKTYGGELANNVTQAAARDVMKHGMFGLEAAGYPITLTVHDEIVCEVPDGHGSVAEMESVMCDLPEWAAGLPVAAEGFEGRRYRK